MNDFSHLKFRFRLTQPEANQRFVIVFRGQVECCTGAEEPVALSQLAGDRTVLLRKALEEAEPERFDGSKSGGNLRKVNTLCVEALRKFCPRWTVEALTGNEDSRDV